MAMTMKAATRPSSTKGELRKLRMAGHVPGIIYGKQLDGAASVSVDEKDIQAMLRTNPNAIMEIEVPAQGSFSVMVSSVQRDPLSRQLLHVDFHQISMNEPVRAFVRVEVTGDATGVREGGIMQAILHEIEVQCLPSQIPDMITADITALEIGENLFVSDLHMPAGVEVKVDPQLVVVTILAPQKEAAEDELEEAGEAGDEKHQSHQVSS